MHIHLESLTAKEQRRHEWKWDDVIVNQDLDDEVDEDNNNDGIVLTGAIYVALLAVALGHALCLMVMKNVKRLNDTLCHGLTVKHNQEEEGRNMSRCKIVTMGSEEAVAWTNAKWKSSWHGLGFDEKEYGLLAYVMKKLS
ncbi:hypothetical protein Tco_0684602 [Tanacetum coccineum]